MSLLGKPYSCLRSRTTKVDLLAKGMPKNLLDMSLIVWVHNQVCLQFSQPQLQHTAQMQKLLGEGLFMRTARTPGAEASLENMYLMGMRSRTQPVQLPSPLSEPSL